MHTRYLMLYRTIIPSRYDFPRWQPLQSCLTELLTAPKLVVPSFPYSRCETSRWSGLWFSGGGESLRVTTCSAFSSWALITKTPWISFIANVQKKKKCICKSHHVVFSRELAIGCSFRLSLCTDWHFLYLLWTPTPGTCTHSCERSVQMAGSLTLILCSFQEFKTWTFWISSVRGY